MEASEIEVEANLRVKEELTEGGGKSKNPAGRRQALI